MVAISTMPERLRKHAFRPGNNANPRGRPRGSSLTAKLREIMDRPCGRGGRTVADAIAEMIVRKALRGNFAACKLILDRLEGPVPRRVVLDRDGDEYESTEILLKWVEDWKKVATARMQAAGDDPSGVGEGA